MELAKIQVSGLLINHVIVNAPPVDRYVVKNGFVVGEPLGDNENRRVLAPVRSERLKNVLADFQRVGKSPTEEAVLKFVNIYGLPLPGDQFRQPLKKIAEEAKDVREMLLRYKKTTEETKDDMKRYRTVADVAYSIISKLEGVRLHIGGLQHDEYITDSHHALGLTVEPALYCPDMLSYIYLQLYLIVSFRQLVQECKGCGAIFSPQRRNASFCSMKCYKAYWKRMKKGGERDGK